MSSSKEGGTAAAAQQLGSMSLGGESAAERKKDDETEPTAKNTPTKMCSACGKVSDTLKKCNGCKCVWYCDKDCQNRHRKEHKKECRRITKELDERGGKLNLGTEVDVGPLGKLPPKEECPICMRALPIHTTLQTLFNCCGKTICGGCNYQHQMKSGDGPPTCAFCRTTLPESDEEILARARKRVELKDPKALANMAMHYGDGYHGLTVDQAKCVELLRQSADLGFPEAQYQLAAFYHVGEMGLEQNVEEGLKYTEKAAKGGQLSSLHNLGGTEGGNGDRAAAMRHWRLSASGGLKISMDNLIICFEVGSIMATLPKLCKPSILQELRSEDRDQYIAYLKRTGKYEEVFDM